MKKKIHKIWGVGLTIVLAGSLLFSAAPVSAGTLDWGTYSPFPSTTGNVLQTGDVTDLAVAADGTMYAVSGFATLGTQYATTDGTYSWDTTKAVSGNYSAKLTHTASSDGSVYVEFVPVMGITIADLADITTEWSFQHFTASAVTGPQLELRFTILDNANPDGAGHVDVTLLGSAFLGTGAWQKETVLASSTEVIYYGNDPTDGTEFSTWAGGTSSSTTLGGVLAAINANTNMTAGSDTADAWRLTKVRVEIWDGSARDSYIDDVTIDGKFYNLEAGLIYKSTNSGVTWSGITNPDDAANAQMVAVAPDDSDIVAIVADGTEVYVSANGGSTWGSLGTVTGDVTTAATINDLAISATDDDKNHVAVAGVATTGAAADVWYFDVGAAAPAWEDTADEGGTFATSQNSTLAVAFSPNVASDKVMTAVTTDGTEVYFQVFSLSTKAWNTPFHATDYPVEIEGDGTTADIEGATHAAIELAPDYLGSDDAMRIAFVGLTTGTNEAGIYRLEDTTDKDIYDGSGVDIHSLDYDGTTLIAGFSINDKIYRSSDPLATTPSFSGTSSLKRAGTAGNFRVVLGWMGSDVAAGTRGAGSAFAISKDSGASFTTTSVSLISQVPTWAIWMMSPSRLMAA